MYCFPLTWRAVHKGLRLHTAYSDRLLPFNIFGRSDLRRFLEILILAIAVSLIPVSVVATQDLRMSAALPMSDVSGTFGHRSDAEVMTEAPSRGPSRSLGCPRQVAAEASNQTIERVSGEERGPRIAEPMVFDLIRPLGVKRGEREVNVLGLVPLRQGLRRGNGPADPLGLVRRSPDRETVEWAPEIEYAVCDGLAFEFEVPMETSHVEAYKGAGQFTFGTAFNHRFIHGAQAIVQYGRDSGVWTTTGLYLAGFRFDQRWSVLGMVGGRGEVVGPVPKREIEFLTNITLFSDVTDRMVAGIETNLNQVIGRNTAVLVMPQLHYELDRHWMIQGGVGARFTTGLRLPIVGFRIIREF